MKNAVKNLTAIFIYLILLCYLLKTDIAQLFSLRLMGMLLIGGGILCLPYLERRMTFEEWKGIFGKNALTAGYMETFMLLFIGLQQSKPMPEGFLPEVALALRPLFYGFICYIVLWEEEGKKEKEERQDVPEQSRTEEKASMEKKTEGEQNMDLSKLTGREKQVAELIRRGLSNREIGEELFISETTVKRHVSNIFEKLEISSRKELKRQGQRREKHDKEEGCRQLPDMLDLEEEKRKDKTREKWTE